jgi:hypothetical protein
MLDSRTSAMDDWVYIDIWLHCKICVQDGVLGHGVRMEGKREGRRRRKE